MVTVHVECKPWAYMPADVFLYPRSRQDPITTNPSYLASCIGSFSGSEEDWEHWYSRASKIFEIHGYGEYLKSAEDTFVFSNNILCAEEICSAKCSNFLSEVISMCIEKSLRKVITSGSPRNGLLAWSKLCNTFKIKRRATVTELRLQLARLAWKDNCGMSFEDYLSKMKTIYLELSSLGENISEHLKIAYFLKGLPHKADYKHCLNFKDLTSSTTFLEFADELLELCIPGADERCCLSMTESKTRERSNTEIPINPEMIVCTPVGKNTVTKVSHCMPRCLKSHCSFVGTHKSHRMKEVTSLLYQKGVESFILQGNIVRSIELTRKETWFQEEIFPLPYMSGLSCHTRWMFWSSPAIYHSEGLFFATKEDAKNRIWDPGRQGKHLCSLSAKPWRTVALKSVQNSDHCILFTNLSCVEVIT